MPEQNLCIYSYSFVRFQDMAKLLNGLMANVRVELWHPLKHLCSISRHGKIINAQWVEGTFYSRTRVSVQISLLGFKRQENQSL